MAPNIQTPPPNEEKASHQFHQFVAPEAWTRSPIMRVLSPPSSRTCAICGSSTSIDQILANTISIDLTSPINAIQKYTNGASDRCFSCTTILGLLRSISNEEEPPTESRYDILAQVIKGSGSGTCRIVSNDERQARLYQIFVAENAPSCPINVPRLPILCGPSSSEAVHFIKRQIKTCLKTHPECRNQAPDFIPTRLLYITRDGEMHLRFQTDIPASTKYAALSHRWGRERIHMCSTTRDNIDSRKQSIGWDELPQLFHDAVALTLRLGLSYIWIDSLCIVQGDDFDWNRETSDMARIFNSALVTIATHCSQDPSETMFPAHGLLQQKVVTIKQGSKQHDLFARELTSATAGVIHNTDDEFAPLFNRAWPFQECLVSTRVIHVRPRELIFECRGCITCQCGQHYNDDGSITARHVLARMSETSPIITRFFQKPRPVDDWPSVVEHYSQLELSVEKDRLIALGAYAQQYLQAYPGRQYLAGMWSNELCRQLLWRNKARVPRHDSATPCIAPSWSWASAGTAIEYTWKTAHDSLKLSYKVLDFSCRPVDGNPFGAAIDGKIRLEGYLSPARLVVMAISVSDDSSDSDSELVHHISIECEGIPDAFHFQDVRLDRFVDPSASSDQKPDSNNQNASSDDASLRSEISDPNGLDTEDIVLLKLFDSSDKSHETSSPSIGYMMLQEVFDAEKSSYSFASASAMYKRLGIAIATSDGGHSRKGSTGSRPSVSTRRSSMAEKWNRVMGSGGTEDGKIGEVVII